MSKKSPAPTPTEIVVAGQPSAALTAKLKTAGALLTDEQIASAWRRAEEARATLSCAAIAVGALLLAKKQSLKHGAWLPWCETFGRRLAAEASVKLAAPLPISELVSIRSLRDYAFLAQHFLASVEQNSFAGEAPDHRPTLSVAADDVLTLDTADGARRAEVFSLIERFVAGRSLRTMLMDFRRAENAADAEEAAEASRKAKKKGKPDAPGQMDFLAEMMRPIGEVDALLADKTFIQRTDKAFWIGVADKLEAQARQARQMAKQISA